MPGTVELIGRKGDESAMKDISAHKWTNMVGLHGLDHKLYNGDSAIWPSDDLPTNRRLKWYNTTFKAPLLTNRWLRTCRVWVRVMLGSMAIA